LNPFDIIIYLKLTLLFIEESKGTVLDHFSVDHATVYVESNCSDSFAICQIALEYQSNPFRL